MDKLRNSTFEINWKKVLLWIKFIDEIVYYYDNYDNIEELKKELTVHTKITNFYEMEWPVSDWLIISEYDKNNVIFKDKFFSWKKEIILFINDTWFVDEDWINQCYSDHWWPYHWFAQNHTNWWMINDRLKELQKFYKLEGEVVKKVIIIIYNNNNKFWCSWHIITNLWYFKNKLDKIIWT